MNAPSSWQRADDVRVRIAESRRIFLNSIWPLWSHELTSTAIISTEDSEKPLEREADFSGTDAFFVRHKSGTLIPLASRIEFFDEQKNNPNNPRYWDHYPRFTIRLAKTNADGSLFLDVECQKRLRALEDPISRRYLPLYTFQSIVRRTVDECLVIQSCRVETEDLFSFIRDRNLASINRGAPSRTRAERDVYRIVTVEKLRRAGIEVSVKDFRVGL